MLVSTALNRFNTVDLFFEGRRCKCAAANGVPFRSVAPMAEGLIVLNAGSSSVKFALFERERAEQLELRVRGGIDSINEAPHFTARAPDRCMLAEQRWSAADHPGYDELLRHLIAWAEAHIRGGDLLAAGHRVVHGGTMYSQPVLVTEPLLRDLQPLLSLAPLHLPHNLAAIEALRRTHPNLPQVACFDTAFHHTQPRVARLFGIPRKFAEEGVVRYGFHGLSYEYIASVLPRYDQRAAAGRTIVAHLGSGASLCALIAGHSVATTLGFGGLDGLLMGTRCGSLDPEVVIYLLREKGMTLDAVDRLLEKESGLQGVSAISADMRDLLQSAAPAAKEAIELFVYRIIRETGSMVTAAGGIDAFVFTAGIGEHAWQIRSAVCSRLACLGIELDEAANRADEIRISSGRTATSVLVIPTDEERMIAVHTMSIVDGWRSI
jgi:acetate kinase